MASTPVCSRRSAAVTGGRFSVSGTRRRVEASVCHLHLLLDDGDLFELCSSLCQIHRWCDPVEHCSSLLQVLELDLVGASSLPVFQISGRAFGLCGSSTCVALGGLSILCSTMAVRVLGLGFYCLAVLAVA